MEKKNFKLTYLEILIIICVVVIVAYILTPVFLSHNNRKGKYDYRSCTRNLRELSYVVIIYSQDNGSRLPGLYDKKSKKYVGWVSQLLPYTPYKKDKDYVYQMFSCHKLENENDKYEVNYGYNANLIQPDGMGINEKSIIDPSEVGLACDSESLQFISNQGGVIGDKKVLNCNKSTYLKVKPVGRHGGAVVVGFADGHIATISGKYDENDKENGVNKAFYRAVELGYIKKSKNGR